MPQNKKGTNSQTSLMRLVKEAVLKALDERLGKKAIVTPDVPPANSNQELMNKLVARGMSDDAISEVFTARYHARGLNDPEWIAERIAIYKRISERTITPRKRPSSRRSRRAA